MLEVSERCYEKLILKVIPRFKNDMPLQLGISQIFKLGLCYYL
jgi:hypothetical protein